MDIVARRNARVAVVGALSVAAVLGACAGLVSGKSATMAGTLKQTAPPPVQAQAQVQVQVQLPLASTQRQPRPDGGTAAGR